MLPSRRRTATLAKGIPGELGEQAGGAQTLALVVVDEAGSSCVEVRLPLRGRDVAHVASVRRGTGSGAKAARGTQSHGRGKSIHELIVPLVERRYSPITLRAGYGSAERSVRSALGEGEILAVLVSKAHVALGPVVGVMGTAAVESFIRCAAQTLADDATGDRIACRAAHRPAGNWSRYHCRRQRGAS